jgi:hypothetical protein
LYLALVLWPKRILAPDLGDERHSSLLRRDGVFAASAGRSVGGRL